MPKEGIIGKKSNNITGRNVLSIEFGGSCMLRHKHVHIQCNMLQYKDLILNIDAS